MAAPGWPKSDTIPEASVVQIDADSSHHGSHNGSYHGSRHGSQHGGSNYVHALQTSRESGNGAKLERRASRRLENAALGVSDWPQDYTDDYPIERDSQAQVHEKTKTQGYTPWGIIQAYFRKWKGGMDEVGANSPLAVTFLVYSHNAMNWTAGLARSSHS